MTRFWEMTELRPQVKVCRKTMGSRLSRDMTCLARWTHGLRPSSILWSRPQMQLGVIMLVVSTPGSCFLLWKNLIYTRYCIGEQFYRYCPIDGSLTEINVMLCDQTKVPDVNKWQMQEQVIGNIIFTSDNNNLTWNWKLLLFSKK